jgi:hypothetical protein
VAEPEGPTLRPASEAGVAAEDHAVHDGEVFSDED